METCIFLNLFLRVCFTLKNYHMANYINWAKYNRPLETRNALQYPQLTQYIIP